RQPRRGHRHLRGDAQRGGPRRARLRRVRPPYRDRLMQKITLIDTSVLLDLLAVPGRDQDREAIGREMKDRRTSGERFLLPITTVVETGNHIAQIKDHTRREVAERFAALLEQCLEGKAPFRFDEVLWDQTFLQTFISGAGTSVPLI